jgi:CDP-diacylglycerol--glycerol-3-phosphate 3-phosphatidyltransferase
MLLTWLPNLLTLTRVLMIPAVAACFYAPLPQGRALSAALFVLAATTDALDGYLARRLQLQSALGAFLDPVADKLMVTVVLILLVGQPHPLPTQLLITAAAAVIVGREITISALREWMGQIGARVAVSATGKLKTVFQMSSLSLLLYQDDILGLPTFLIGLVGLVLAAGLTVVSMVEYLTAAWPALRAAPAQGT